MTSRRFLPGIAALSLFATANLALFATVAAADNAFFQASIKDLKITEGKLPEQNAGANEPYYPRLWRLNDEVRPYGVLDGKGEIYVQWETPYQRSLHNNEIEVRAAAGADVTGTLFLPKHDLSGMVAVKFKLPADAAKDKDQDKDAKEFYTMKAAHYRTLWQAQLPGGAWFRHEMREAERKLGNTPNENGVAPGAVQIGINNVDDTLDLFSGGRAIAENLQLERTLPNAKEDVPTVDIDSLSGITISA